MKISQLRDGPCRGRASKGNVEEKTKGQEEQKGRTTPKTTF